MQYKRNELANYYYTSRYIFICATAWNKCNQSARKGETIEEWTKIAPKTKAINDDKTHLCIHLARCLSCAEAPQNNHIYTYIYISSTHTQHLSTAIAWICCTVCCISDCFDSIISMYQIIERCRCASVVDKASNDVCIGCDCIYAVCSTQHLYARIVHTQNMCACIRMAKRANEERVT